MGHELRVLADADAVAAAGAEEVAGRVRDAAHEAPAVALALSGGRTPWAMFDRLAAADLPWDRVVIYQVDERVAPEGDPARNLERVAQSFARTGARVVPMPVNAPDLEAAAEEYASALPAAFDLVHLGLGPDGHTASLVPGDPVLDDETDLVALTDMYQGHRRMTLTYRALARADELLWLVTGAEKADALAALLAGDDSIPAARVESRRSLVLADEAAARPGAAPGGPRGGGGG